MAVPQEEEKIKSSHFWILLATILASGMSSIDASAMNIALPAIQKSFKAPTTEILWVVSGYSLMLASLILLGGILGDRFGRKKIFSIGILIFILASFSSGLSLDIHFLIASRIIQGIGGALMIPGSLAIISDNFQGEERGKAIGIWSAAGSLLFILGPPLGGFLAGLGLWRFIFFINIPLGILSLFLVQTKIRESLDSSIKGALDIMGMICISLCLACLTYGFTHWPEGNEANISFWISLSLGISLLLVFLVIESRAQSPMVPLHLFKRGWFSGANLMTFFLYGALGVFSFFFPANLIRVQGYSFSETGLAYLAFPVPLILLSRYIGGLSGKLGPRYFLITGTLIASLAFFWLSTLGQTPGPEQYFQTYFFPLLLLGFGMSLVVAPLTNTVMSSLPNHYSGTASGINNAITRMAFLLVVALVGSVSISFFKSHLMPELIPLKLGAPEIVTITQTTNRIMETEVPPSLTKTQAKNVHSLMKSIFLTMIQFQFQFCALLSLTSALLTSIFIGAKKQEPILPSGITP